jgi:glutamate-1-semialdehyde 2,1-aminomutase
VPQATRDLTHGFAYNDLASLERLFAEWPDQIAAVILEPMNVEWPAPGFLEGVRALTERHGALLVFDETITGFRYSNGGAAGAVRGDPRPRLVRQGAGQRLSRSRRSPGGANT